MTEQAPPNIENVTFLIDGKEVCVPKGTNVIEAAKSIGVEIPHYCYHKDLSVAGNCRMCQVKVKGAPKLDVACNLQAKAGMEVSTHHTSPEVKDAQAATLEFILINHPLDCTICDQAGHCKLQDYHFNYNAKDSRFVEEKEHKSKAVPLGPTVMLDGERCIMCTRCIRFCDEITKTSELGMLNRGDRSVIAVSPGKELNNPFSGTVVDLCPVGALTHSKWRFNTRVWFTSQTDSICPGCSTGCNVKVYERDGELVQVKARYNKAVNHEWLCDSGRYGFGDFLPKHRVNSPLVMGKASNWEAAISASKGLMAADNVTVFAAPNLTLEEFQLLSKLIGECLKHVTVAIPVGERKLSDLEKMLVSPDRAANFRGAEFCGLGTQKSSREYEMALVRVRHGQAQGILIVGEGAVNKADIDDAFLDGLRRADCSVASIADRSSSLCDAVKVVLPGRSILEKTGLLVNGAGRLQLTRQVVPPSAGSEPEFKTLLALLRVGGKNFEAPGSDRDVTLRALQSDERLRSIKLSSIVEGGVQLEIDGLK